MTTNKEITIKDLESKLWESAEELRGSLSAEEYMHVVLDIITLKYINDKYIQAIQKINDDGMPINEWALKTYDSFNVPEKSKWDHIKQFLFTDNIGQVLDDALIELGKYNNELSGIFIAKYNEKQIDKIRLSEVIKIFDDINISNFGEDILGRVYEYFLGQFFLKRGQKGGEFYTPISIVKLIVGIIKPLKGRIYDPACGSCGMFVQAKKYIEDHHGDILDIMVYGQEKMKDTWNLGKLNLILNGFSITSDDKNCVLGNEPTDTFTNDQHKDKVFEYIMANPPFNLDKYWHESLENDSRWQKYGLPPKNNANFAWLQHILFKLSTNGKAGVVLANGSLTSTQSNEDKIRKNIIKDNKVSCIVSLPDKLFFTTGISACIWFFDNNKKTNDILFINASKLGDLIEGQKKNKEIKDENISKVIDIYNSFENGEKINIPGLAKSVSIEEIEMNEYSLLPGQYIETKKEEKEDPIKIKQELKENINELLKLMEESRELEQNLFNAIKKINFDD
ncbi:MAG: type I restriction-modification system subunit M [Ureaplasma sp.]|nr:type I restriction-modification system subunit M [Ureaplasma sp.]MDE7221939.1 type I restriction-modification system subunit M [Ureaplasma sp.]